MMADSPLFSATITTGHPHRTYIGAPMEYFLHSNTTNKPAFLSLPLPTSTMCYLPRHNQSPTTLHTRSMFQANHIAHAPVLEVMGFGHHKDLGGFESASFGTLWSTSLFIICSFYYHMLSKLTPYMFMFLLCINTPVCCMYFASSNINLATYCLDSRLSYSVWTSEIRGIHQESGTTYKLKPMPHTTSDPTPELNSIFELNLSCYGNTCREEDPSVIQHYARRIFNSRKL